MRRFLPGVFGLVFFSVLTLGMMWPVAESASDRVHDLGDPLLNIWILSWNADQWRTEGLGAFLDGRFLEASIYYPHPKTLAFSEVMLPQSALAAAWIAWTGNPVLAYNAVFLISLFLSGFSMFLLSRKLTHSTAPALLAGMIFAFSPFTFDHLSHVQIAFTSGFPLTFLFLVRVLDRERTLDVVLLAAFFSMQLLANGYYAVFLTYFFLAAIFYHFVAEVPASDVRRSQAGQIREIFQSPRTRTRLAQGILFAAVVLGLCGPVFWHYMEFQNETGFKRLPTAEARIENYLAVPASNLLRGGSPADEAMDERRLYPGALPAALALFAIFAVCRGRLRAWRRSRERGAAEPRWLVPFWALALFGLLGTLGIAVFGERLAPWGLFDLSPPFIAWTVLLLAGTAASPKVRTALFQPLTTGAGWIRFAFLGLIGAFVASYGLAGPYRHLIWNAPGFDAIRAVTRIQVLTLFCLAILAAYGLRGFLATRGASRRLGWMLVIFAGVFVEYASWPSASEAVPAVDPLPQAYQWLAEQPRGTSVLELPLRENYRTSCRRVFYAVYHFQPTVDGYSGFLPPFHRELARRWRRHPSLLQSFEDAGRLGTDYAIVHRDELKPRELQVYERERSELRRQAHFVGEFGAADIWALPRPLAGAGRWLRTGGVQEPRRTSRPWQIVSASHPQQIERLNDGDRLTSWTTGELQSGGEEIVIDLGQSGPVAGVVLARGGDPLDFPRALRIETSSDAQAWQTVLEERRVLPDIERFLPPYDLDLSFRFARHEARFLRLTQTSRDGKYFWSMSELEILTEDPQRN